MTIGSTQRQQQTEPPSLSVEQSRQIEAFKKNGAPDSDQLTLRSLATPEGLQRIRKILRLELNEFQLKLNSRLLKRLETEFVDWVGESKTKAENNVRSAKQLSNQRWLLDEINMQQNRKGSQAPRFTCDFLFHQISRQLQTLAKLRVLHQQFRRNMASANTKKVRREIILHFAQCLTSNKRSLAKDKIALDRWFDEEALNDRFLKRQGEEELMLSFTLDRLATTVVHVFHRAMEFNSVRFGGAKDDLRNRIKGIWQRLDIENSLLQAVVYEGDVRIHVAAMRAIRIMLTPLPPEIVWHILSQRMVSFIDRAARQKNSDVWIQCEALTILSNFSIDATINVINQRLGNPGTGDDIFVRRHAWGVIENLLKRGDGHSLEIKWHDDPSSFVRQKMAESLFLSLDRFSQRQWRQIVLEDPDPKVRSAALATAAKPGIHTQQAINFFRILPHVIKREKDEFVLRTAMWSATDVLQRSLAKLAAQTQGDPTQFRFTLLTLVNKQVQPALQLLQSNHPSIPVRRWAAQCNERIWALLDKQIHQLLQQVGNDLRSIKPGRSKTYPMKWFNWVDDITLTRMFAVLSQDDFGYDIEKTWRGLRVSRGPSFGFRLWRLLHEIRRPATDKRQGHRHMIGRISTARLKAPSQILGELSETKVPGEPLTIASDSTWRPFLPLVDDLISALNMSWFNPKTIKIVSNQGVTLIIPPAMLTQRVTACYRLTKDFAKFATLRNWDNGPTEPDAYIRSITDLGFKIRFSPHQYHQTKPINSSQNTRTSITDTSVTDFFNIALTQSAEQTQATLPLATHFLGASQYDFFVTLFKRFTEYFTSLYENSLGELVVFACFMLILVMVRHAWLNFTFRRSRNSIPFSIGGWGTRGKSGTERLKSALLGVMGHGLVSKTTGCEAMFIHAYPFGPPLEIPFFRPYDKATIWEQRNLVNIAAKLKPSVFLWECMALNPAYVNVLQHQWMQDDIATITNTYPDHEDIQGPAGYDVAQTISGFVPKQSLLVTTEEQMKPYVTHQCQRMGTQLQSAGWLQSGLITDDILNRFPYQEHPDNIALVSQMATNLGIPYEQSVKAMADDLVPDLGVLKTHPIATVRNRKIEFTNGMSANERFGCMGNWKRLRYDAQDPWTDPTTWVICVINNRADRVPRSKVFAKMIVDDLNADRFFLIGTNLNGLKKFIDQAWQTRAASMTLTQSDGSWDTQHALETLQRSAWQFRQPTSPSRVTAQIQHMIDEVAKSMANDGMTVPEFPIDSITADSDLNRLLRDLGLNTQTTEAIIRHQQWLNRALAEYQNLHQLIQDLGHTQKQAQDDAAINESFEALDRRYRTLLGTWFSRKFVIVADSEATGEQVIGQLIEEIPPGYTARTMGMQNIKGTGLDFVYRFQAWDVCFEACEATQDRRIAVAEKAIAALVAMPEIGQLCLEKMKSTIQRCRTNPNLQRTDLQSQLDLLARRVATTGDLSLTNVSALENPTNGQGKTWPQRMQAIHRWSTQWAEEFLDVNDSIRRREKAELIYKDFVDCRISRQRAVVELRALNKRQKGGWLKEDSKKLRDRLRFKPN